MRLGLLACLGITVALPGCASAQRGSGGREGATEWPDAAALRERAAKLWTARTQEDWATAFLFEEPERREQIDLETYVDWHVKNEPFKTHAFRLGKVQTDRNLGWVEVECRTSLRKFENVPPRDVRRWEKWRVAEGDWYPVPAPEKDRYPEAPALRDAAEEKRLRARFDAAWAARQRGDPKAYYEFVDPAEREQVTLELLTEYESLYRYLSCNVRWVEVIGVNGRVRVEYERKRTDPSLQKMPPELSEVTERWVKREDDWNCRFAASAQ